MPDLELVHAELVDQVGLEDHLTGQVSLITSAEALPKILSGEGMLAEQQTEAPLAFLGEVLKLIVQPAALGPRAPSVEAETKMMDKLLRNNVLQDYVDGQTLSWHQGTQSLLALGENCWVPAPGERLNIVSQLYQVLMAYASRHVRWVYVQMPPDEEIERLKLMPVLPFESPDGPPFYFYQLPVRWNGLFLGLQQIKAAVRSTINQGLARRQVFAVEERGASLLQLSPSRPMVSHLEDRTWYVLTRDLPSAWFKEQTTRVQVVAKARHWIEEVDAKVHAMGKHMTGEVALDLIVEEFSISRAAAREAWRTAARSERKGSGNINKDERISLIEIRRMLHAKSMT